MNIKLTKIITGQYLITVGELTTLGKDIPDVLRRMADKLEPVKEPETLTLEEARESDSVYLIHPVTKEIVLLIPSTINVYYTLAAHIAAGHYVYPTRKDAQFAKDSGWS